MKRPNIFDDCYQKFDKNGMSSAEVDSMIYSCYCPDLEEYCDSLERFIKSVCASGNRANIIRDICSYKCCGKFRGTKEWTGECLDCLLNTLVDDFLKYEEEHKVVDL